MTVSFSNPLSLDLTQAEFQGLIDAGADAVLVHKAMHDASALLPSMLIAIEKRAREHQEIERVFRHFMLDCVSRARPVLTAWPDSRNAFAACIEAGKAFADGCIDQGAIRGGLAALIEVIEDEATGFEGFCAMVAVILANGWGWLNVESGNDLLDNALVVFQAIYSAVGDLKPRAGGSSCASLR